MPAPATTRKKERAASAPARVHVNAPVAAPAAPVSIRVQVGNALKTLTFTNEEDAKTAAEALDEQKARNAESAADAMTEIAALRARIADLTAVLEEAQARIEELLSPEGQAALVAETVAQEEDEAAIIEAETENEDEREKEKQTFANSGKGLSLPARRDALVARVLNSRGVDAAPLGRDAADAVFRLLAMDAKNVIANRKKDARRIIPGLGATTGNIQKRDNTSRILAAVEAMNK